MLAGPGRSPQGARKAKRGGWGASHRPLVLRWAKPLSGSVEEEDKIELRVVRGKLLGLGRLSLL